MRSPSGLLIPFYDFPANSQQLSLELEIKSIVCSFCFFISIKEVLKKCNVL